MRGRLSILLLGLAIVAASCSLFGSPETTSSAEVPATSEASRSTNPGATSTPPVDSTSPAVAVDVRDCDAPTDEFVVFCDAYETLTDRYVDELDDAVLAAGAIRGLNEYRGSMGARDDDDTTCHIPSEAFKEFCGTLASLEETEGLTDDSLIEAGIRGMVDFGLGDPNTNYFDPLLFQEFTDSNNGQVQGIGSLVNTVNLENEEEPCQVVSATCELIIVSPLPGSPSEAVGLQPDDTLISVDGELIDGLTLNEVVAAVRGPAGSEVGLAFERDGEPFEVTIVRAAIEIPIVEAEMVTDDIGYIRLLQFTFGSAEPFREELAALVDAGAQSIILDLQSNPGGSLDDSVAIASEFLTDGIVVRTESPSRSIDYDVRPGGVATDPNIRVFVLINGGSASASEVVAGALSDQGRAILVGQNSFGKNTVQQNFPLENGGALKITIARWVTPNGVDFDQIGLDPDVLIEYPDEPTVQFLRDEVVKRIEAGQI